MHDLISGAASERRAIAAVWRPPFAMASPCVEMWPEGVTVAQIVQDMRGLPASFTERGVVLVNGVEVPREAWPRVRPKSHAHGKEISITLHMPMQGGGDEGGGGKQIFAVVALIALTVLTAGINAGWLAAGGFFLAGSTSAAVLAGSVGVAGALAISALSAPPAVNSRSRSELDPPGAASAEGNVLEPSGAIPRVVGTRKVFPALASEPIIELIGQDEFVEAVYVLNGPHLLSDIRVGDARIEAAEDVTYETREGWEGDGLLDLVTRQGRTLAPQIELSTHEVDVDQTSLKEAADPISRCPVWHATSTRSNSDEVWLHLAFPEGLWTRDNVDRQIVVPFRIRIRKRGDVAWINLPELHFQANKQQQVRAAILLKWRAADENMPVPAANNGWVSAYRTVAVQAPTPPIGGWTAHASFTAGSGGTGVTNCHFSENIATIFLPTGTFPKGVYDIEIKRGYAFDSNSFNRATYAYASSVRDFFGFQGYGPSSIARSRDKLSERVYLVRLVSVWNEHPVPVPGFATIAIRAKNRRVDKVSSIASGYVRDWDGTDWNTWTTTSNPAPHFVDMLSGSLNLDPLPAALRDNAGLLTWRTACTSNDYTCDAIIDGTRINEALTLLASCGYARPYHAEVWGVIRDYDRSAEAPVQIFTPRNMRRFQFRKAFARKPDGFRVSYRDDNADYDVDQLTVYVPGFDGRPNARLEQVTYDGLVDPAKVGARASFDLDQVIHRSTFYSFEAPVEALVCRRGSLIEVHHDTISRRLCSARIRSTTLNGSSQITTITLDSWTELDPQLAMHDVADMLAIASMHDIGLKLAISIRLTDGAIETHQISSVSADGFTVTLATPIPSATTAGSIYDPSPPPEIAPGCLVAIGESARMGLRLIVSEISPGSNLTAAITAVDEAPQLWQ